LFDQGILTKGERLSTFGLLIKVVCFVKSVKDTLKIKRSLSKLVITGRSTVLSLPL
jgi:hypothetical protein